LLVTGSNAIGETPVADGIVIYKGFAGPHAPSTDRSRAKLGQFKAAADTVLVA